MTLTPSRRCGRRRNTPRGRPGRDSYKVPVFGMVERNGRVKVMTVPNVKRTTLLPHVVKHVIPASTMHTDELKSYNTLAKVGYGHKRIHHSEQVYVSGDIHVNTIEGIWSLTKRGIGGVYHSVSAKHLQGYLNERYNNQDDGQAQFERLFLRAALGS